MTVGLDEKPRAWHAPAYQQPLWLQICPAAEWVDGQERLGELPRPAACDFVPAMLAKLFLPTLLPADLDTVLYIDCDVLIRTSIVPLLQLQLNGTCLP
jgi:hypothetical protein